MKVFYGKLLSGKLQRVFYAAVCLLCTLSAGAQTITWYRDVDADGWGIPTTTTTTATSATTPSGYVLNNLDCNDANSNTTTWNNTGIGLSEYGAEWTTIKLDAAGTPYVAYNDNTTKGSVLKYSGGAWSYVGVQKFTGGQAHYISMAFDASNNPYMAYRDNGYQASMMKFNGTSWEYVGSQYFTPGGALYTSMVLDASNVPYVAFRDEFWMSASRASVMKYNGSSWVNVGAAGFTSGTVEWTSLAIDGSGTLYMAFCDNANSSKITVMKYNGSSWVLVGTAGFSTGSVSYVQIAIDITNVPFVAYKDGGTSDKVCVKKFNGSTWVNVGAAGFSAGSVDYVSLAIDKAKNPIVAYKDNANSSKATVMRYNGSSWVTSGSAGISSGSVAYTTIALSPYGVPYVAYQDASISSKLSVENLAPVVNYPTIPAITASSSTLCTSGTVTLTATGTMNDATAWKWYTGGCGTTLIGTGASITTTVSATTTFYARGENICSSSNGSCGFTTVTFQSSPTWYKDADNDGWGSQTVTTVSCTQPATYVGNNQDCNDAVSTSSQYYTLSNNPINTYQNQWTSIAIDRTTNTPYIAYYEDYAKGSVMKYVGGTWTYVGSSRFTAGATQYNSLVISTDGTPYMAYQDAFNGASVMMYDLGSWSQVGSANFSDGQATYVSIALNPSEVPYVAYKDAYFMYANKATVMAYNSISSSWEYVGSPGFSPGTADYTSIAIDGGGTPWVAFSDGANSGKVTVMRYISGNWSVAGSAGFSAGSASYVNLAINSSGTPYVVYKDGGNSNKATVMRFNGTSWVLVGTAGFTPGSADYTSLAFAGTNIFVAYSDGANSNKASVMRFNGTTWAAHGTAISSGSSSFNSIAVDNKSVPITAYMDASISNRAFVQKAGPSGVTPPTTPTVTATLTTVGCGVSTTLTATGTLNSAAAWYWYTDACGGSGTLIGTGNSIVVTPTVTTTYYAMGDGGCLTNPGSCGSKLINSTGVLPVVANITGPTTVCEGQTITLSNTTPGGVWSSSHNSRATVNSSGIVTGVSSAGSGANISYTVTNACGSVSKTYFITVKNGPGNISGSLAICIGDNTNLGSGGSGPWTSSNTGIATVNSSGNVIGVSAGTVNITHTLTSTGCYKTVVVTVNATPGAITGTTSICLNQTSTLTASPAGGTWTSSNTSNATIDASTGVVTPVSTGNSTIRYTLGGGSCYSETEITLLNTPDVFADDEVCDGASIILASSDSGPWTSSNTSVATVSGTGSNGTVTGQSVGTATITHSITATGCYRTAVVTVNQTPTAITGGTDVCLGSTLALSSTPSGGTWTSSLIDNATVGSSSGIVSSVTTGTSTIRYTLSNSCYAEEDVTVLSAPNDITGTMAVCLGVGTSLTSSGTGPWASSNTGVATVSGTGSTGTVTSVGAGTAIITHTLTSTGCYKTAIVTINPLPSSITGITLMCLDEPVRLSNSIAGGTWVSSTTSRATIGSSTGVVTPVSAGTTTISYTLSTGCRTTTVLTVAATPGNIAGTLTTCPSATTTLTSTGIGPWSSSNTGVATINSSGVVSGVAAGTTVITHTVTLSGCMAAEVVTVNALPSVISGSSGMCLGTTTTLTNATGGGTWVSSVTARATIGSSSGIVTPVSAGTTLISYTVTATGCRRTVTFTVAAAPSISLISNNGPICAGATLTLSTSGPSNVLGYNWLGPVSITGNTSASATVPSATTLATGVYSVNVNNGTNPGCIKTYTTSATVKTLPVATPANNGPICPGGSATLSANPSGGATTYAWSGSNLSSATVQNPTATPTVTSTYSLTVTDGSGHTGCSPTTIYTTTVTRNTTPTAAPTNNGPACNGGTVTLSANPGGSTNTYLWSGPNLSSTTAQNPTATPTTTSTYSLTVSYGTGFPGCSPSTVYTTTVTVYPEVRWLGTTSTDWFTASNWCGGVPNTTKDVLIMSGTPFKPLIAAGTAAVKNLTLNATTTLNVTGGTLQISGTPSSSGTFSVTGGTIEMNGSSAQAIPASLFATNTINNLTLNNAAGLTLGGELKVRGIVKATTGNIAAGGYLTLLSTSTQTALVDGSGAGNITGNTIVQRYLPKGFGYKYISAPVAAATVGNMSSYIDLGATFPRFYSYDENLTTAGWVNYTTTTNALTVQKGFAANFGPSLSPLTFQLSGVVNNGTISTTIYNRNRTYTLGFNLVGNPYPSPINWTASSGWTKTNIDNAIYYFDASDTNMYTGVYSSYVGGVSSDGIASNIIPAMQGFFVHVSNGSYPVTGTLGMTNSVRVNSLTPVYHKPTATIPLLRLDAGYSFANHSDPTAVYFNDGANGMFNLELDALKLMNTDSTIPNLYTITKDDNKLSIQALKTTLDNTDVLPLGIQTPAEGAVKFGVRSFENIPADINIFFYDAHTKHLNDLRTDPPYQTSLGKGTYDNRFFLLFTRKGKSELSNLNGAISVYSSGNSLFVYALAEECELSVTDIMGRVIAYQKLIGTGLHEVKLQVATGVYFATINSAAGRNSTKVFIGN